MKFNQKEVTLIEQLIKLNNPSQFGIEIMKKVNYYVPTLNPNRRIALSRSLSTYGFYECQGINGIELHYKLEHYIYLAKFYSRFP